MVIVAVARWRGLLALAGLIVAFVMLVVFLLPALRGGAPALPVALTTSAAILIAVIYLAHGLSLRTSAALLGTLTSLLMSALLSWAAIEFCSALPLLLLFSAANRSLGDVLTGESVAIEIVRSVIGVVSRWRCRCRSPPPSPPCWPRRQAVLRPARERKNLSIDTSPAARRDRHCD